MISFRKGTCVNLNNNLDNFIHFKIALTSTVSIVVSLFINMYLSNLSNFYIFNNYSSGCIFNSICVYV